MKGAEFFPDWQDNAADAVANLRAHQGRNPHDERVARLVDDLNRDSEEFRTLWRAHDVRYHDTGYKRIRHPLVGELTLTYEVLELPADPGQSLVVYGAEPGSPTADSLRLLASWTAEQTRASSRE